MDRAGRHVHRRRCWSSVRSGCRARTRRGPAGGTATGRSKMHRALRAGTQAAPARRAGQAVAAARDRRGRRAFPTTTRSMQQLDREIHAAAAPTGAQPIAAALDSGVDVRYFYDTEFIDDGRTIELISIGVAAEDGREYYAVSTEFDPRARRQLGAHQRAAQVAVAVVAAVALAPADPDGPGGLLRRRRRRADRAVGLGRRLRPRGAVPAVGADDRSAARDPAVHPRAAAVLGGARVARGCRRGRATPTTHWSTPGTTCCGSS